MNMNYFRNKTNTLLGLYDIGLNISAGCVVGLTDEQVNKSIHLQHFISKDLIEKVDKTAQPIIFGETKAPAVVLPDGVKPEVRTMLNVGVDDPAVSDAGEGTVIVGGRLPGQGQVKTMAEVVQDGVDKIKVVIDSIPAPLSIEKKSMETVPEDLKEWFNLTHTAKKLKLMACVDIAWLEYVAQYDTEPACQRIIAQRIAEVKSK